MCIKPFGTGHCTGKGREKKRTSACNTSIQDEFTKHYSPVDGSLTLHANSSADKNVKQDSQRKMGSLLTQSMQRTFSEVPNCSGTANKIRSFVLLIRLAGYFCNQKYSRYYL